MSLTLEVPNSDGTEPRRKLSASRGVNLPDLKIIPVSNYQCESGHNTLNLGPTPPASASSSIVGKVVNFAQNSKVSPVPPGSEERQAKSLLELCVFLPNHSGLQYTVEGGRLANVSLLRNLVLSSLKLPASATDWFYEVFTLWMQSPLLEVQLKPHHIPFKVRKCWTDLLEKFVSSVADEEERETDEPLLILRRNVLLSRGRQLEICRAYPEAIELLQSDAQDSILEAKYVGSVDQCLRLAALQMVIEWGPFNSEHHTARFIRENWGDVLPDWVVDSLTSRSLLGFSLFSRCRSGVENDLLEMYQSASEITSTKELKQQYLNICLEVPSYGCASFSGQIEQRDLIKSADLKVTVGINRDFLCIVDVAKKHILLTVSIIDGLTWTKADPVEQNSPDCLPSLFLHFPDCRVDGQSKLIQVFSKQVCMMNALLTSVVDTPVEEYGEQQLPGISKSRVFTINEDVLCTATFDRANNCIEVNGSLANCVMVKAKKSPKKH